MEAGHVPREADLAPAPEQPGIAPSVSAQFPETAALGLAAFATTTFILSIINAGLVGGGTATQGVAWGMFLFMGGLAQFTAGVFELRSGNTFAGVAFCSFGAFWGSFYILLHSGASTIPHAETASAIGLYLWAWGIFTVYMFIASLRTNGAVAGVLLFLAATFIILAIGNTNLNAGQLTNTTIKIGGYTGLISAILAWYGSFAIILNGTWGRDVLPLFPLTRE